MLIGPPDQCAEDLRDHSLWLQLDDEAFARKLSAARNYPELQAEVAMALNGAGQFRVECLRPVNSHATRSLADEPPYYELYGEKQVRSGYYKQVLRYSEHMLPLIKALDSYVERNS
jgi:hypothetical protein